MSEHNEIFSDLVVDESLFLRAHSLKEDHFQAFVDLMEEEAIHPDARIEWMTQFYENDVAAREGVAFMQTMQTFLHSLSTKELLDTTSEVPTALFIGTFKDTDNVQFAADIRIHMVGPTLADDIALFAAREPFVVDEPEFRARVLQTYADSVLELTVCYARSDVPYNKDLMNEQFIFNGDVFTYDASQNIILRRGGMSKLPKTPHWRTFLAGVIGLEVESYRAEALASSLQRAWRIDDTKID